jgi:hypothetical protein
MVESFNFNIYIYIYIYIEESFILVGKAFNSTLFT